MFERAGVAIDNSVSPTVVTVDDDIMNYKGSL